MGPKPERKGILVAELFSYFLNMSIAAGVVILFLLPVRAAARRMLPLWVSYCLWSVVLVRLLLPVSFSSSLSVFSLLPQGERVSVQQQAQGITQVQFVEPLVSRFEGSLYPPEEEIQGGGDAPQGTGEAVSQPPAMGPAQQQELPVRGESHRGIGEILLASLPYLWLAGAAGILLTAAVFYLITALRLRRAPRQEPGDTLRHMAQLLRLRRRFVLCRSDLFATPVVSGVLFPKIVIPLNLELDGEMAEHILTHELVHIKRRDNLIKIVSLAVLALHWFNPLVWAAYRLSAKDMESSCDERVLVCLGGRARKEYAYSLLNLAIRQNRTPVSATFLAFGDSDVKRRVKDVLRYRRATALTLCAAVLVAFLAGFTMLANPRSTPGEPPKPEQNQELVMTLSQQEATERKYRDSYLKEVLVPYGNLIYKEDWENPGQLSLDSQIQYAVQKKYNIGLSQFDYIGEYFGDEFARIEPPEEYLADDVGYIFPQEEIEEIVEQAFGTPPEQLRENAGYLYLPEREGYWFFGGGLGEVWIPRITGVREENGIVRLTYDVCVQASTAVDGEGKTVQFPERYVKTMQMALTYNPDGSVRYLSAVEAEPTAQTAARMMLEQVVPYYDVYCEGAQFQDPREVDEKLLFRYTVQYLLWGNLKQYAQYDSQGNFSGYTVPVPVVAQAVQLQFGRENFVYEDAWFYNAADGTYDFYSPQGIAPELTRSYEVSGIQELSDGSYRMTVERRDEQDAQLEPLVMTFRIGTMPGDFELGEALFAPESRYCILLGVGIPQEEKVEYLDSPQQLAALSERVNSGDTSYLGTRFVLTRDIDMSGIDFVPIGAFTVRDGENHLQRERVAPDSTQFRGFAAVLDGQGHTIRNLKVDVHGDAGLIACLQQGGEIRNLKVQGSVRCWGESDTPSSVTFSAGGLAGISQGRIENCTFTGTVEGMENVGGLVGELASDWFDGGIIKNCVSQADILGCNNVGGLVGSLHMSKVQGCLSHGTASLYQGNAREMPANGGGAVGSMVLGSIEHCGTDTQVKTQDTARIVGGFVGYYGGRMRDCLLLDRGEWKPVCYSHLERPVSLETVDSQREFESRCRALNQ